MNDVHERSRLINFPLIAAGFVFLANPYIDMLDIFPDFIGCLLIFFGISALAKLDDRLALASKKLIYLAILSFARLAAFVLSITSDSTMILTLTFAFGVAEIILILVFLTDFFGGIEYLLQRYDGYDALSKLSNIKFLSVVFFIAKITLCVLPNTVAILEVEAIVNISASTVFMDIVAFKPYAVMLFFIITLIIGIWWYSEIFKYFNAIKKDKKFISEINGIYEKEITSDKAVSVVSSMRRSFILTAVGLVFLLDIMIEKISVLPDIIATLLIWAGAVTLKKQKRIELTAPAVLAFLCQIIYAVCVKRYAYIEITRLADFPVKNAVILAAVGALYSIACFFFLSEVFNVLCEFAARRKAAAFSLRLKKLLVVYAFYLILTVIGITLPTVYITLILPRIIVMVIFIIMTIKQYYITYDEYTAELQQ
ncbi:MAG: hypothetical protein PHW77_04355 [Eubacteriales bacterium]|nr:hypothetical protein [Eubacteriales bacterium]